MKMADEPVPGEPYTVMNDVDARSVQFHNKGELTNPVVAGSARTYP